MQLVAPTTPDAHPSTRSTTLRSAGRWMLGFAGFPLGGFASMLAIGPVDSPWKAVAGGLLTGAVVGGAQALALGRSGPDAPRWVAATAVGLAAGLGIGATAVGFATTLPALVVQGAISGLAVGLAQAFVLWRRLGRRTLVWPPLLALIWAAGWTVTTVSGVQVDDQFTVFGSFGAITVTALTLVLPFALARTSARTTAGNAS